MDKEITLCKESKELLKYVEERYKEVKEYVQTKEVLIHMYPERDTKSDGDEWWGGYMDALFVTVKVYNPETKTVFIMEGRDTINLTEFEGHSSMIKMFKDKSTMIHLKSRKNIRIIGLQCVDIY